jgi:flagellin FlaB
VKAQAGMGTLILFIALILVSSMVVAVIIDTTNLFAGEIKEKAKVSEERVTTSLKIVSVSGSVSGSGLDTLYIVVEPLQGTINISSMVIELVMEGGDASYLTYSSTGVYEEGHFTVSTWIRMRKPSTRPVPFIEEGDMVELSIEFNTVQNQQKLGPDSILTMVFFVEGGIDKKIELKTPSVYPSSGSVVLYP